MSDNIKAAVIAAIASIVVAVVGTFTTIWLAGSGLQKLNEDLTTARGEMNTLYAVNNLPVGSVLASLLTPDEFRKAVNDDENWDPQKSRWTLADDKGKIPGTEWAKLTNNSPIPDLRGMFLRGVNHGRNDGNQDSAINRTQGSFQQDSLQNHSHRVVVPSGFTHFVMFIADGRGGPAGSPRQWDEVDPQRIIKGPVAYDGIEPPRVDVETRPKNVAVYYYLKIN